MIEETRFNVTMEHMNGRTRHLVLTASEVDKMYDKLWRRDTVAWLDTWDELINLEDIRYIRYVEIEEKEL